MSLMPSLKIPASIHLLLFVAACTQMTTITPASINTQTFVSQPTPTVLKATTSLPEHLSTNFPEQQIHKRFLNISEQSPVDLGAKGEVLLSNEFGEDFSFLDLITSRILPLLDNNKSIVKQVKISPSGKHFAYLLGSNEKTNGERELVVSTNDGQIYTIPWQPDWIRWDWLGNDHLIAGRVDEKLGSYLKIDFRSKETDAILINEISESSITPTVFHYLDQDGKRVETSFAEMFFNPALTQVIHFGLDSNKTFYDRTFLRNLSNGGVIVDLPNILIVPDFSATEVSYPAWALDGNSFLIEVPSTNESRDLFEVNSNGDVVRLTFLANKYNLARFGNYSFSPDRMYVAFWLLTENYNEYRLSVINTTTNELLDTCIPAYGDEPVYDPFGPFWAPDGHKLVIGSYPNTAMPITILIDLDKYTAITIAKNMVPQGWMEVRK